MADPIIKIGSTGAAVRKAQKALNNRGEWLTVDGIFGALTRIAVIKYQVWRAVGEWGAYSYPLKVDGIVGPATWSRLTPPVIKKKSKGNAVRLLQEILKDTAWPEFDPGKVDGDFGPQTESAVKNFQNVFTLTVDGIVGEKTWAVLGS